MTLPPRSIIDTRRDQMFPVLEPEEIERVSRFGEVLSYQPGDAIVTVGRVSPGVIVILSGKVDITQRDQSGHRTVIVIHSAGGFPRELAPLAGPPAVVHAPSHRSAEAPSIPHKRVQAVLVAEADLPARGVAPLILR